jgi:DNA recombination-dependent growth factor C
MGALKGSIAVRRYLVLDELGSEPRKRLSRGLRAHAFAPVDPAAESDRSWGWVSILDEDDADLTPDKTYFVTGAGEQLRVSLRLDVLRPPAAEVKRQVAARAAQIEAEEGRRVGRRERRTLKEEVGRALRKRAFPRTRTIDLVWNLDGKSAWFFSQGKAHNELLLDLWAKSFGLRIEADGPARWAAAAGEAKQLSRLEPTRELWLGFDGVRPLSTGGVDGEDA